MARRPAALVVALLLLFAQIATATTTTAPPGADGDPPPAAPVEAGLAGKLAAGTIDTFVVEFTARANLKPAGKIKDHDKRGQYVLTSLRATAAASQKDAREIVKATRGAKATSYWLTNVLVVRGDAKLAKRLAKAPGVSVVRAPKTYPLVEPVETRAAILAAAGDPEWGVEKIRADAAWAKGVTGSGVVVANIDTGVDYQHPALVNQYRGNLGDDTFDHNYNWWDPTGICGSEPCDNVFHGTHTMGTMVGGDGPGTFTPDIGVAPGARWIAAKGCEENWCTEESLLSAGQFVLAPTDLAGLDPQPALRPDIVNNSWGAGPGDPFYLETVQAWRAAGIIPVFSSGNPGSLCGEGGSPGDFLESFSAGATDIDDQIADFSGRGPSVYGKINPDVSAPGVNVSSSVPGGGYEAFDGTSMAAPHVTGTLALMLSAEPALRDNVAAALDAVRISAVDRIDAQCGGDEDGDPNNVYGDGRIDAYAAVELVANGGTLAGTVTDAVTGTPIPGATIAASDGDRTWNAVADDEGRYELFLAAGTYLVGVEAFGYFSTSIDGVVIVKDTTTVQDVALETKPRFTVTGRIMAAEDGSPLEGAAVRALGTPVPAAVSDATGAYALVLPIGEYTLRAAAGGCTDAATADVNLTDADITQDFALARKLDAYGHGCRSIPWTWADADIQSALFGDEFAGRLRLPFDIEFYDERYGQVFLSDNGYVNFLGPDQGNSWPSEIPSADPPNAAIYALWEDLYLGDDSSVDYAVAGTPGTRTFTIQYTNARVAGSQARLDFQVRLHETPEGIESPIDLLFGDNPPNPGDGRNATIGIENATGTDALQFGFREGIVEPRSAFRFEVVPSGWLKGTVSDLNDGLPIAGATISVTPGIHTATTQAEDGTYQLRLMPGTYAVIAGAEGHESVEATVTIADGATTVQDFALAAPLPSMTPGAVDATVDLGQSATRTVTIANDGTAPLDWELVERDTGFVPAPIGMGGGTDRGLTSRTAPRGYVATRVRDTTPGGKSALLIMDALPWGSDAIQVVLDANGIPYDIAGSDSLGTIELGGYKLVIVANDQPQEFYDALVAEMGRLETYVSGGGFLFFGATSGGWNFGDLTGAVLPGGAVVGDFVFDDFNDIAAPDHPVMAGLPDPFSGTSASHTVFAALPADTTVIARSQITGEPTLIEYRVGSGQLLAFAQPMEYGFYEGQDTGTILVNAIPYAWSFAADAPWLSATPATGTLQPGQQVDVELTLGTPDLAAGSYTAQVFLIGNFAKPSPPPTTDVSLTVTLPEAFGEITGTVVDAHDGSPIGGAAVVLHAAWPPGSPRDFATTTGGDGTWSIVAPEGTWPFEASLAGYLTVTGDVTVTRGTSTHVVEVALHRNKPHASIEAGDLSWTVPEGVTRQATITISNPEGHVPLTFETHEVNIGAPGSGMAAATAARTPPTGAAANARTTRGLFGGDAPAVVPKGLMMEGDVLASWPATGLDLPWGVGSTGTDVWISDPDEGGTPCGDVGACIDAVYTADGTPTRTVETPWATAWPADMAFGRGLIWQLNVGGDNGLYGLDPADGTVVETITGSPWSGISQRGVAYDPAGDVFYIGGWNEGIIYRVAGPAHPTPGETLDQCSPADPAIAGLAWNPAFGLLWQATNAESDTVYLLDPTTCETLRALPHPDPGYNAGGLELDPAGNLWMISMGSRTVYLVESGLPNYSDAPWLTVSPASGTVAPDESATVNVTIDTTGLTPGVYRAAVVITTNDEDNSLALVPVTVTVPAYLQGVNAGGPAFTDTNTDQTAYAADRAYAPGAFGWVGASSTRTTRTAIDGTDADALYQDLRTGMTGYRFDVPDGHYQVVLRFAELTAKKAGARVFSVSLEGATVAPNLDLFATAGGRFVAYDLVFETHVSDGVLDIGFVSQRGDLSVVNAILVTEIPAGG